MHLISQHNERLRVDIGSMIARQERDHRTDVGRIVLIKARFGLRKFRIHFGHWRTSTRCNAIHGHVVATQFSSKDCCHCDNATFSRAIVSLTGSAKQTTFTRGVNDATLRQTAVGSLKNFGLVAPVDRGEMRRSEVTFQVHRNHAVERRLFH